MDDDLQEQLARIERKVDLLFHALRAERRNILNMETLMNINFDGMAASLEKIKGVVPSTQQLVDTLTKKIAELSASMDDPVAQAKVDEFAAAFAAEADKLPKAIAANPAPADAAGASAGGVTGVTG